MKKLLACLPLLAFGCSVPRSVPEGNVVSGRSINAQDKVLILSVIDGQEQGQAPANGSGKGMVTALRKTLMEHNIPVSTSESTNLIQGFDEASKLGFDYVLKCVITEWEDNATAWSGKGDKLRISVEIFDAKSKTMVAAASHYRIATGFTFVSGSPDRFMDECSLGALSQVYKWSSK
ncbi:MAG: DUF4823 domain-containing protein [Holophagaceae bacterium]|jgi:hypothetical protein|uniref:DUF4823 domain-containing protein n=1 Tax=Candidatus Geothrix odensensis TaxID=2954440 RepID=A0A936K7C1_9BACT|nr:DUF4823 domain-containing protein [Candidatus Geothrix odensensis]